MNEISKLLKGVEELAMEARIGSTEAPSAESRRILRNTSYQLEDVAARLRAELGI